PAACPAGVLVTVGIYVTRTAVLPVQLYRITLYLLAASREGREAANTVSPSRAMAINPTRQNPQNKVKWSSLAGFPGRPHPGQSLSGVSGTTTWNPLYRSTATGTP